MKPSGHRLGVVLVTASAIAWSTAGFFTRVLALDPWTMLAWRGLFGAIGIALAFLALERRRPWKAVQRMGLPGIMFAVVSAVGMVCFIVALKLTTVAHVSVIYAAVPLVAAALGWVFLREVPSRSALVASMFALTGVLVMVGFGREGSLSGDLLAVAMTACMAGMVIISRRFRDIPTMPAACLSALLSGIVCWPLGAPLAVSGHDLLILALFGLVNSAVGLALFTIGAKLLPAVETALIGSLDSPLAPLWVWIAFDETPSVNTMIGAMIVFVAVASHVVADTKT